MQTKVPLFAEENQTTSIDITPQTPTSKLFFTNLGFISLRWMIIAFILTSLTWLRSHDIAHSIQTTGYTIVIFGAMLMIFGTVTNGNKYGPAIWGGYHKELMDVVNSTRKVMFSGLIAPTMGILFGFLMVIFA